MSKDNAECCPQFNPEPWDDKLFEWEGKKFISEKVKTFLYMPLNFGSAMKKIDKLLRSTGVELKHQVCLSDHTSKWNMDILVEVDKEIPNADNSILNGKYYSRVYEGKFSDTDKWCKDFEEKAAEKGLKTKKWYMWYTTCPKCAKKYGKNYVAVIGEVE